MIRQGDVLLIPCTIPQGAKVKQEKGDIVLALGEATGHSHRLHGPSVALLEMDTRGLGDDTPRTEYVRVAQKASISHEEHAPAPVEIGDYQIVRQREYSPEKIVPVRD